MTFSILRCHIHTNRNDEKNTTHSISVDLFGRVRDLVYVKNNFHSKQSYSFSHKQLVLVNGRRCLSVPFFFSANNSFPTTSQSVKHKYGLGAIGYIYPEISPIYVISVPVRTLLSYIAPSAIDFPMPSHFCFLPIYYSRPLMRHSTPICQPKYDQP